MRCITGNNSGFACAISGIISWSAVLHRMSRIWLYQNIAFSRRKLGFKGEGSTIRDTGSRTLREIRVRAMKLMTLENINRDGRGMGPQPSGLTSSSGGGKLSRDGNGSPLMKGTLC